MVFKKIIFQNSLMANETPSRPPLPLMANAIINFHFDFLTPSLIEIWNFNLNKSLFLILYFHQHIWHAVKVKQFRLSAREGKANVPDQRIKWWRWTRVVVFFYLFWWWWTRVLAGPQTVCLLEAAPFRSPSPQSGRWKSKKKIFLYREPMKYIWGDFLHNFVRVSLL